jgi:DNA (cytosine-5)-methyltransferase 1
MADKPRLLDLFCGAGGAAMGYHRAGFEVVGVDIKPQPHYPFEFYQADALTYPLDGFDVIHASPPCQAYCALRHLRPERDYPDLIVATRGRLIRSDVFYVIENVPKAPLIDPVRICGSWFGLRVRRHRMFESNSPIDGTCCNHVLQGRPIDVSGTGGRRINRRQNDHGGNTNKPRNIKEAREAMGIDWMTRYELSQAIPPAYTEFIGRQIIKSIGSADFSGRG